MTSQPSWPSMLVAVTRGITRADVPSLRWRGVGADMCEKVKQTNVASVPGFSRPIVNPFPERTHTEDSRYSSLNVSCIWETVCLFWATCWFLACCRLTCVISPTSLKFYSALIVVFSLHIVPFCQILCTYHYRPVRFLLGFSPTIDCLHLFPSSCSYS